MIADALSNAMNTHIDVALILWNPDVIQLVSLVLLQRNLKSCGAEPSEGVDAIEDLIVSCGPRVVVFDLAPPYDRSSGIVLNLLDRFPDRSFVMTCADKALALRKAPWLSEYPVFQKPYEMDDIANTVRFMVRRAPVESSRYQLELPSRFS
jgi:hypothetical protein